MGGLLHFLLLLWKEGKDDEGCFSAAFSAPSIHHAAVSEMRGPFQKWFEVGGERERRGKRWVLPQREGEREWEGRDGAAQWGTDRARQRRVRAGSCL